MGPVSAPGQRAAEALSAGVGSKGSVREGWLQARSSHEISICIMIVLRNRLSPIERLDISAWLSQLTVTAVVDLIGAIPSPQRLPARHCCHNWEG